MNVWGIADLHLSFGVEGKEMDVFGLNWSKHYEKIESNWRSVVKNDDLVLIAGDISWAINLDDVAVDLEWIDRLPGVKVISKGNHDLWWGTNSKVLRILPKSINIIHNNAFTYKNVTVGGTRLWEREDISYKKYIEYRDTTGINVHYKEYTEKELKHDRQIYKKEIDRLNWSIDSLDRNAKWRIVMVHYPPAGPNHEETDVTRILHNAKINFCIYGHLHNLKPDAPVDFNINKTKYICTSSDWLNFNPYHILSTDHKSPTICTN